MSDQERLFEMECDREPTARELLMGEFRQECEAMTTEELVALRHAELDTLSDTESRIHMLNGLIDRRLEA